MDRPPGESLAVPVHAAVMDLVTDFLEKVPERAGVGNGREGERENQGQDGETFHGGLLCKSISAHLSISTYVCASRHVAQSRAVREPASGAAALERTGIAFPGHNASSFQSHDFFRRAAQSPDETGVF